MMVTERSKDLFSRIVCIFPYFIRTNWKRTKNCFSVEKSRERYHFETLTVLNKCVQQSSLNCPSETMTMTFSRAENPEMLCH